METQHHQTSLTLALIGITTLTSAFFAGPAAAADKPTLDLKSESAVQQVVAENLSTDRGLLPAEVGRFGSDGKTLFLGVSKATAEVKAFDAEYSNVEVEVSSKFVQAEPQAKTDLVGGAGYLMRDASGSRMVCSNGFTGWDADTGRPIILTAGHCPGNGAAPAAIIDTERPSTAPGAGGSRGFESNGTGAPGKWRSYQFGSTVTGSTVDAPDKAYDLGVIDVGAGFTVKPAMTDWTTAATDDLSGSTTPVTKVGVETLGAPVKKAGRTTGLTTGTVSPEQKYEYQAIGGRAVHGFEVRSGETPFSQPGDSGGGVFQGDVAIGVISGGPGPQHPQHGKWSWVSDLDFALEKSRVNFTFTPPAAGGGGKEASANADKDGSAAAGASGSSTASGNANAGTGANADTTATANADQTATANANAGAGADADKTASAASDSDASGGSNASGNASGSGNANGSGSQVPAAPVVTNQTIKPTGAVTGSATPNAQVKVEWKSAASVRPIVQGQKTVNADSRGRFELSGPAAAGVYTYTATTVVAGHRSAPAVFDVTVKSPYVPVRRSMRIEPSRIAPSDFVRNGKGVTITASGFSAADNVRISVTSSGKKAKDFTIAQRRNDDGTISFIVRGAKASKASFYRGKYQVRVSAANSRALTGTFTVVNGR